MSSLKRGRPIQGQTREIIFNVHEFMKKEFQESKNTTFTKDRFAKIIERTAEATRISKRTITRILNEKDQFTSTNTVGPSFRTPKKGKLKQSHRKDLDDFSYQAIRRKIYDFHKEEKQEVTMNALLEKLKTDINFGGGRETLRRIVKELGFKYRKTQTKHKLLAEKDEVRLLRIQFLRNIKKYRYEGRPIVYGDETHVHSHIKEEVRSDEQGQGIKKPVSKSPRLIIVHAGGSNGFIPNALHMYESTQTTGGYHSEMNKENYEKWVREKLIPNLQPNSVFVIDNASYHSTLEDRAPNQNSRKKMMQDWLKEKNIPFNIKAYKPELYDIIKCHKHLYVTRTYSLDTIMEAHGHIVLRLPPYHPDFNPIENIWLQVKGHIRKNVDMNLTEVQQLLSEKIASIGPDEWQKVIENTIKCEDEFMTLEEAIDNRLDKFIDTNEDTSSSSDGWSGDNDGDSSDAQSDYEIAGVGPIDYCTEFVSCGDQNQ